MDLHRLLRSLTLLVFILAIYFSSTLARHPVRHRHHGRHKRQHAHNSYLPGSFVVVGGSGGEDSGDWGPWSEPSDCSRSCGGGIAYQTRRCRQISDSGQPLCQGGTKRYFSCNIQDCPEGSADFRTEQCSQFNNVSFEGKYYRWVPYTKAPNKCELNCMPKNERFYYKHKRKVADGTRCDEEKLDVCVDGECLPVGCDMMLGSTAREDKCRECGGDGSGCNTVQGLLDMDDLQVGYNDILLIPAGATNIRVREIKASNNYLAIRNVTGHYYLNGNWRIDFPRDLSFAGTLFHYERKPPAFYAPESISALGPTTEPIYVVLLYQEANPGIEYEYSIPKGVQQQTDPDSYNWIHEEFSECSATCGGGFQTRNVSCARRRDLEVVPDYLCDPAVTPVKNQSCNTDPCPPQWFLGEWGACSETCGEGGTQTRQVYCEQIVSAGLPSVIDDEQCIDILGPKPPTTQTCNEGVPCPKWHVGPWKPCDRLCGDGVQRRRVQCYSRVEGKIEVLGGSACPGEKPEEEKPCHVRPCEGVDWVVSKWSGCEDKCGLSQETRTAHCANQKGKIYADSWCHQYRLPELVRECESPVPCKHEWFASQWSECSSRCGAGIRTRKVFCGEFDGETVKKVDNEKCDLRKKYEEQEDCVGEEECGGQWYAGPWSACSKPCGGGVRKRSVLCFIENITVDITHCKPEEIFLPNEECNNQPCSPDQIMTLEPSQVLAEEDEEECEEDESTYITVETTLGLNVTRMTPLSGFTELEGSGETDLDSTETTSEIGLLTSTGELPSSISSVSSSDYFSSSSGVDERSSSSSGFSSSSIGSSSSDGSTSSGRSSSSDASSSSLGSSSSDGSSSISSDGASYSTASLDSSSLSSSSSLGSSSVSDDIMLSDSTFSSSDSSSDSTQFASSSSSGETLSTDMSSKDSSSISSSDVSDKGSTSSLSLEVSLSSLMSSISSEADTMTSASSDSTSSDMSSSSDSSTSSPISSSSDTTLDTSDMTSLSTSSLVSDETGSGMEEGSGSTSTWSDTTIIGADYDTGLPVAEHPGDEGSGGEDLITVITISSSESSVSSSVMTTEVSQSTTEIDTTEGSITTTEESPSTTEASVSTTEESTITTEESQSSTDSTPLSTEEYTSSTMEFTTASSTDVSTPGSSTVESTTSEISSTESSQETDSTEVTSTEVNVTETTYSSEVTETGSTESDETEETEETEEVTGTTPSPAQEAVDKELQPKKCKKKKKKPQEKPVKCEETKYGCCPDGVTAAKGPFSKDCPTPMTCLETEFGCCPDGVSPAEGTKYEGCPPSYCEETLFGCCPDGITIAEGNDYEGCKKEEPDKLCKETEFGCCPDGVKVATGPDFAGCFECEGSGECETCNDTKHGCCPDGVRAATGPDFEGCEDIPEGSGEEPNITHCSNSTYGCCPDGETSASGPNFDGCGVINQDNCTISYFGCCPDGVNAALGPRYEGCRMPCEDEKYGCCSDGITPAHGPNQEGCCLNTKYGCCPDNILAARGPNLEDCGCQYNTYGCCPDNKTAARGPENEGCGCQYTKYGCCPNLYTPAAGPHYEGCLCYTYQFGCCPDGITIARGPHGQGCGCENTEYGCCSDERTPALGPNKEGCGCEASQYGCCPDAVTDAKGEKFEGCEEVPMTALELCVIPKDRGSCRDFTVKWYYDTEYGGCTRFWYGGCEGNQNRFASQEECKQTCVEPEGRDACFLPKIAGPCEGYYPMWYYDSERKQCGPFVYGGCLGNNNKFETMEECHELCVLPDTLDTCEQERAEGPCKGNFTRWYYDKETRMCKEFTYGGCKGNSNNFVSESACHQKCLQPGRSRDYCSLPRAQGNCTEQLPRWFFDASENRCMPFYYSGCEGNANRFETQEACEADCPPKIEQDICNLPALVGECHNYTERWYYDSFEVRCKPFYYGGCGGNHNNFPTMQDCQRRCESGYSQSEVTERFKQEWCFLPEDSGTCRESSAYFFYDRRDGICKQFLYGGCEGNENRFTTREECEHWCGNAQDPCFLPRVVGPCDGYVRQWYYDSNVDNCYEFDFGGCQGNANRFNDQHQCEEACKRGTGSTAAAYGPGPLILTTQDPSGIHDDICSAPVDPGPCNEENAAWYYNKNERTCEAFSYGGCGGNANRFESEEQCERHCGRFKDQDVCSLPYDVGPCTANLRKWYYNPSGGCEEFGYGGCNGNGNRFSSLEECEAICLHRQEPQPIGNDTAQSHQAICRLPVDTGPCRGNHYKRWYFDEERRTCIPFIYTGCAGNLNRFKNFQTCLAYCSVILQEGYGIPDRTDVKPNEIDVDSPPEKPDSDICQTAKEQCNLLHCPYGVERYIDSDGCERCQCHDPCRDHICSDDTKCAVDLYLNPQTSDTEFRAVCRDINKPGECPKFTNIGKCIQECQTDADCTGDAKCCTSGCFSSCLHPLAVDHLTTQAPPDVPPEAPLVPGVEPPRFEPAEPEVQAEEGNFVTLKCIVRGNPTPTITWKKGSVMIDGSGGRHKLLLDGSLQIVGLYRSDAGVYTCTADNGISRPVHRETRLEVTDPSSRPAMIIGEDSTYVVVTLGAVTVLQCYAVGWPRPIVTWWRGDRMLPLSSEQYEQRQDHALLIRSVTLRSLGPYTCQAYNGFGRAASWTVTVQAVGPVYSSNAEDSSYTKYLVPPPKSPEIPASTAAPGPTRPQYPYRPKSTVRPIPPTEPPAPERRPPPEPELVTPRVFTVPVRTNVSLARSVYPVGSDISIPCDVDGYPIPRVNWYKDDQLVEPNERMQITETHRLIIIRASGGDSGIYRCEATNEYGSSSDSISVSVEGIYIHPDCTDNPFFANCRLIVVAQYCTHKYYARFCCKSCTLAGQLPSHGPHLEKTGTGISRRRK